MKKSKILKVQDMEIGVILSDQEDFICITDIAQSKESKSRVSDIIKNWIRNRSTIEFLSTWEELNNPNFKVVESDHFKMNAGIHSFVLTAGQWIEKTKWIDVLGVLPANSALHSF